MRYFITFACYCARLHGDESGSVDRHHNLVGSRLLEPGAERVQAERRQMLQDPYVLDPVARHGSTRWLWKDEDVRHALRYAIEEQGEPMALFVAGEL